MSIRWIAAVVLLVIGAVFLLLPRDPTHLPIRGEVVPPVAALRPVPLTVSKSRVKKKKGLRSGRAGNTATVRHGVLRITQGTLADRTVAVGTQQIPLLRFQALAGRQDVSITTLKFTATDGSLETGSMYRLYVDLEGDGTFLRLPGIGKVHGGILTFAHLDILVADGRYTAVEVRADVPPGRSTLSIRLAFAKSIDRFVEAVGRIDGRDLAGITIDNGTCPTTFSLCWISVFTEKTSLLRVAGKGNLFVTASSTPLPPRQLLLGTETPPLLRLHLRADGEDIEVTHLAFIGGGESTGWLAILPAEGGELIAFARTSGCARVGSGRFCARIPAGALVVPADQEREIILTAVLKADMEGGKSGESLRLILDPTIDLAPVEARGRGSLADLAENDGDAALEGEVFIGRSDAGSSAAIGGPTHDTVLARITEVAGIGIDPDSSPVPVGTGPLGAFRWKAAQNRNSMGGLNDVLLHALRFTVAAQNVSLSPQGFRLIPRADPSKGSLCTADGSTGLITVTCSGLQSSQVPPVVPPGGFLDLVLEGEVTDAQVGAGGSSLQVSFQKILDRTAGAVEWSDGEATFRWVDSGENVSKSTLYRLP